MGLTERRRLKELEEQKLPAFKDLFRSETGLSLPIELDVESLASIPDLAKLNEALDWITGYYNSGEFWTGPIAAWKEVVSDDLGRQSVNDQVKAWQLFYKPGLPSGISLENGVLRHSINFVDDGSSARLWQGDFARALSDALKVGGLNLEERRKVQQIETEVAPKYATELEAIVGRPIAIEVVNNFAQIQDAYARESTLDWLRGWVNSGEFWTEIVSAFRQICQDDLGREAVRDAIKTLRVQWESGREAGLELRDGVLTYHYNFADSPGSYRLWASEMQQRVESML